MSKLFSAPLGLTVAIALSAGGVLVEHPLYADPAPRAYSDITIAEADNQKLPPEGAIDKGVTPQTAPPKVQNPPVEGVEVVGEGQKNKGVPPAAVVNPEAPSEVR